MPRGDHLLAPPRVASCDEVFASSWPSEHSEADLEYAHSDSSTDEGEMAMRHFFRARAARPPPSFMSSTLARAREFAVQAVHVALDRRVQRGAAAGALSCGAWGGFWGLCNGSVVGCSVGLLAAPFTLGFSVPLLTGVMAWTGLVVGSSAGVGAGLVGGGCAGYLYSVHDANEEQRRAERRANRRARARRALPP